MTSFFPTIDSRGIGQGLFDVIISSFKTFLVLIKNTGRVSKVVCPEK